MRHREGTHTGWSHRGGGASLAERTSQQQEDRQRREGAQVEMDQQKEHWLEAAEPWGRAQGQLGRPRGRWQDPDGQQQQNGQQVAA